MGVRFSRFKLKFKDGSEITHKMPAKCVDTFSKNVHDGKSFCFGFKCSECCFSNKDEKRCNIDRHSVISMKRRSFFFQNWW